MVWLRSTIFWLGLVVLTPLFFFLGMLAFPLPKPWRYRVIVLWTPMVLAWLQLCCGLKYEVFGRENVPQEPSIIASKHQSAWETLGLQLIFPPQVWVLKRELLWIPFFGWGLAMLNPIAINRSDGARASQQLREQGRERIAEGFWIVIFPEGTRVPPGERRKYKQGAARLAKELDVAMVPVAHNAGEFWPRNSYLKYPGTLTVVIGKPLHARDFATSDAMMKAAETWIEEQQVLIGGRGPCANRDA